jgi:hypothetical protein
VGGRFLQVVHVQSVALGSLDCDLQNDMLLTDGIAVKSSEVEGMDEEIDESGVGTVVQKTQQNRECKRDPEVDAEHVDSLFVGVGEIL